MIVVFARSMKTASNKKIIGALNEAEESWYQINPADYVAFISSKTNGYDHLEIFNNEDSLKEGAILKRPKVCIWRGGATGMYGAMIHSHLICMGVPCTHTPMAIKCVSNKILAHQLMSAAGVKNPKTRIVPTLEGDKWQKYFKRIGKGNGGQVIIKTIYGSQGAGVYYCKNLRHAKVTVKELLDNGFKGSVMFQQFIETADDDGRVSDIRAVVINGEIIVAMKRTSDKGSEDKTANISTGGTGEKIELTDDQREIVLKAAESCDMKYSICGVDLVTDENDETYVLELNSNIGLKVQDFTGVNVAKYIVEFAKELRNGDGVSMMERNKYFKNSIEANRLRSNFEYSKELIEGWNRVLKMTGVVPNSIPTNIQKKHPNRAYEKDE